MILFLDETAWGQKALITRGYSKIGECCSGYFKQQTTIYLLGVISKYGCEKFDLQIGAYDNYQIANFIEDLLSEVKLKYPDKRFLLITDNLPGHLTSEVIKVL